MLIDNFSFFNKMLEEKKDPTEVFSNSILSGFTMKNFNPGSYYFYLEKSIIKEMTFVSCSFAGVHLRESKFINTIFIDCNFAKSEAFDTHFENCIFENCSLLRFLFNGCSLRNCIFDVNNDRRLIFSECRIEKVIYSCSLFNEFTVSFDDSEVIDLIYRPASANSM
jgi:uncharacterized protein YjbI with pentapeptide repeats